MPAPLSLNDDRLRVKADRTLERPQVALPVEGGDAHQPHGRAAGRTGGLH